MKQQVTRCILWGATGQAKVLRPILKRSGIEVIAVFDNASGLPSPFADLALRGGKSDFEAALSEFEGVGFVVCIGGTHGRIRCEISHWLESFGLIPISAFHHSSIIAESATMGIGQQILAGAIVCEEACIGPYCILNTGCSVDHECRLGEGVHLMPGARLAGLVEIGEYASVGTNAAILPRIKIGREAIVGAGAVVTKNVPDGVTVVGCPARPRI